MNIRKSTYELLLPIIAAIDGTITINSVVDNGGGSYQLNICDTLWASQGFIVTIQGNPYTITHVEPDSYITVTGTALPIKGIFTLYAPKFYHGSIKATEEDLNKIENNRQFGSDKLPLIWLHEPTEEEVIFDDTKAIERNSSCNFYFMNEADFAGFSNEDHYKYAIAPMRRLIESFMKAIDTTKPRVINSYLIKKGDIKDLPRFGRYTGRDGSKQVMFEAWELSGSSLNITLPFIRTKVCC